MSYTKRQLIEAAFEEVGLAAYTFDLTPAQMESALRRMDSMLATWNSKGIRISYPLPRSPEDSGLDEETIIPDRAVEAIVSNLALRLAPSYGKQVAVEVKTSARQAYEALLARAAMPSEMQFPKTLPAGAGNRPWVSDNPFMPGPVDPVLVGPDGPLEP